MLIPKLTYLRIILKTCATLAIGLFALQVAFPLSASAQGVIASPVTSTAAGARVVQYWTAERMKSAVSLDIVVAGSHAAAVTSEAPKGRPIHGASSPPTVNLGAKAAIQLYTPDATVGRAAGPANFGTNGFFHTTGRQFPPHTVRAFPNKAAGKLFFSDTLHGGDFVCSASVIRSRIVVTAGHCIFHGSANAATRHFYTNVLFIPAFDSGAAPYNVWPSARLVTTANWAFSGAVPNTQDVGMIEVQDRIINRVVRKVANLTGRLGFNTLWFPTTANSITQLGYPCNLDSCQRQQITHAQGVRIVNNNVEIGSAQQGGSSGGPWIRDHGSIPAGSPITFANSNRVLGVTSYQYLGNPSPQILGASIFQNVGFAGGGFGDLLKFICANRVGNCP